VGLLGLVLGAAAVWGKEPTAEVKRQLFPAQEALAKDSLDLAEREANKALTMDATVTQTHLILGEVALRKGEPTKAQAHYKKALELGGGDAEAHAGLALVALGSEDVATAETEAKAGIAADKGNWVANYAMGRVLIAQGKTDEAFKLFEKGKGLKGRADNRDYFEIGMGLVALAEKDASGAETNFIKARALAPNTLATTMTLAYMYEATGQWSQAANVLQAVETKFGGSPELSYRLGRAFENQRQWNDALRQYQKAYKADSTFTPALASLGHLYLLDRSKTGAAVDVLTRAVAKNPTPAAERDLGIALTKAGKPADAVPHLEKVMQSDPSPETKVAMARAYVAADMLDKGLPLYEDVDVATDAPAPDLMAVGAALIKAKRYEDARPWLDKALEKDPNLSDVYSRRGFIDLMAKKYDSAITNFQKKIEMDPKSASTYLNLAQAYQQTGKKAEALAAYRSATTAAPNSALVWAQLGQALAADSAAAAAKAFDRALAIDPASVAAKRGKGLTLLIQEQYAPAISLLAEATTADPNDADGLVYLAQAYAGAGKQADAKATVQRALKVDPANKAAQDLLQQLNGAAGAR
jgi:tetratricopeptide (TPR) repeat protein